MLALQVVVLPAIPSAAPMDDSYPKLSFSYQLKNSVFTMEHLDTAECCALIPICILFDWLLLPFFVFARAEHNYCLTARPVWDPWFFPVGVIHENVPISTEACDGNCCM